MEHDERMIQRPFAVVTGAAQEFGQELARLFALRGFDLIITDNRPGLIEFKEELARYGGNVLAYELNLATFKGVEELSEAIRNFGHPVDTFTFHSNAGPVGPFLDTELNLEILTIRENILSPTHLIKGILKGMVKRGHGKILVTSTLGPSSQSPFEAVYGAVKSYLFSFTEAIRSEVRSEGVTVTTLLPNLYEMPSETESGILEDYEELASESFDALMAGRDYVFHGSLKSKIQSMVSRLLPDKARALISPSPS